MYVGRWVGINDSIPLYLHYYLLSLLRFHFPICSAWRLTISSPLYSTPPTQHPHPNANAKKCEIIHYAPPGQTKPCIQYAKMQQSRAKQSSPVQVFTICSAETPVMLIKLDRIISLIWWKECLEFWNRGCGILKDPCVRSFVLWYMKLYRDTSLMFVPFVS